MAWYSAPITEKKKQKKPLFVKCKQCHSHIWQYEWDQNLKVCPKCNYHGSINAFERASQIFDDGTFEELYAGIAPVDSLGFTDLKGSYADKIVENRKKSGITEAVITAKGQINGINVAVSIMDFRFLGGSLGSATGEKILQGANYAYENNIPYVVFSASGGARMQEGVLSLMQMAKTCAGVARLNRKNIPFVSVLTNPTTGGVTASYAMMGDVNIAEPGAVIGFAGRRVIEQTIGEKLPEDFQTAEYLRDHGFVDAIVNRKDMKEYLFRLFSYYNR